MRTLFTQTIETPGPGLAKKLMLLNWPFLLLITAIAGIGVAALYSVAGGALDPWASRHVVRYCVGLGLVFAIALSDIRWWMRAACSTSARTAAPEFRPTWMTMPA